MVVKKLLPEASIRPDVDDAESGTKA